MVVTLLIPLAIAALIILIVVGVKAEPLKGGEDTMKNVYVYLVLFATLMMTIGGSVAVFMAAADIVSPVTYYQSFEDYKRGAYGEKMLPAPQAGEQALTDEEMRVRYDDMVASEEKRQVDRAKNNLIKALGWIIIPLPVFIYFQRRRLA